MNIHTDHLPWLRNSKRDGARLPCSRSRPASSNDRKRAGQMTSYSASASTSATPQLFTLPQDQMSHVQVVTIRADHVDAHASAHGRGGVQRLQHHPGHHPGRRTRQPDSGGARRAGQSWPADARRQQPRLFAVAGLLFEGRGFLPPAEQKYYVRAQDLYQHHAIAAARSGAGRVGPQPGPGGPERGRPGNEDSRHQESG